MARSPVSASLPAAQLMRVSLETFAVAVAAGSVRSRRYVVHELLRDLDWIVPGELPVRAREPSIPIWSGPLSGRW